MNKEFDCRPIEVLMLDNEIVKKLKNIFIYTVGDLQLKSEDALNGISHFTQLEIRQIKDTLIDSRGMDFENNIEDVDLLKGKISQKCYQLLARIGIHRVSELMRLSIFELQTIENCGPVIINELQSFLQQYYGDKFESLKEARMKDNPNTIGLGHLKIEEYFLERFRKGGIYTIGDFLRTPETEMLKITGIGKGIINTVKKELSRLKIVGDKEEEDKEAQEEGEKDNQDIICLVDLGIKKDILERFWKCGINTIADYQRRSDTEMLKLPGIGESAINKVNKELLRLKIPRHIEGEDRIEVLNISKGRAECLDRMGIYTLTQLGNTAVGNLLDKPEIKAVGTEKILVEYLMELLVRQELQGMSEIELLKRVKFIMKDIKAKTGDKKTKFRDILEKLRQESEGKVMEWRGSN